MIAFPKHLEQPFLQLAKTEHQSVNQLIEQALTDYLEDHYDARLAETALKDIESGEASLLSLAEAKQLYEQLAD